MTRTYHTFPVEDVQLIKQQMLSWASRFNICCFLDNQQYTSPYTSFECLVGVNIARSFTPAGDLFSSLSSYIKSNPDWIFGHFNYESINTAGLASFSQNGGSRFPDCFLFVPEIVIILEDRNVTIGVLADDPTSIFAEIRLQPLPTPCFYNVRFTSKVTKEDYLSILGKLTDHIIRGDCYELNFCQEFYATAEVDPVSVFSRLLKISPNPFSAYYRVGDNYLLCASPERYLQKTGDKIISQPIKGTSPRSNNHQQDEFNKTRLRDSSKERAENVMIVDLVRNDLSKICKEGTVKGEELFGIYTFPHVHQMISTITGVLREDIDFSDVLQATFPMGSMTGAPKKKVMELIEKYENNKRGIYSGTVGYFTPNRDFDFNVVIRSIVYNSSSGYLSFHTGSAITASSKAEEEYEECMLKGEAIMKVFSGRA